MSVTPEDIEKHLQTPEAQQPDLGLSIDYGSRKNPDQFAQDYSHAKELGLPVDTAERQRGEALRLKTLRDIGVPDDIAKNNPGTAQYLSDPNAAAMSFDEINGLKSYEQILKEKDTNLVSNTMKLAGNRINALTGNLIEFIGRTADNAADYFYQFGIPNPGITIDENGISFHKHMPKSEMRKMIELGAGISEAQAYDYVPMFTWENFKGDMTATNLSGYIFEQGLGGSVPDMLAAVYTLPAYLASRTEEFAEARAKNKGLEEPGAQELGEGIVPAVAVSLLERLAGKIVLSKGGVTSLGSAGIKAAEAAGVEAGTEFVQTGVEYLGERVGTDTPMDAMEALDQMIAGAVAGGGVGGGLRGTTATYEVIAGKSREKANNRMESLHDQQVLDQTITFAQSSTTRQRSKEHFEQYMEAVGKDRNVLIPTEQIPAEFIPLLSEKTRESMNNAIATGTDVEMPLSEFASNIATNPELVDAIRPYIKLDNANRLSQDEMLTEDRSDIDKLVKKAQQEKEIYDEAQLVFEDVKEQLVSTGIQSETTARYSAQLYPAFASVLVQKARKAGDTEFGVLDAYDMMGLKILRSDKPAERTGTIYDQEGRRVINDKMGKPLRVYRGQHGEVTPGQPIQTKSGSITFSHSPATASAYAEVPNQQMEPRAPHVLGAYISMQKPWINDQSGDPFVELDKVTKAIGFDRAKYYANKYFEQIMNTNNWEENYDAKYGAVNEVPDTELGDLYLEAYHLLDDPEFISELKAAGYDGAIYGGSGESALETEFRVFDESQIVYEEPKNQYGFPEGTPVIVSEPWSDLVDLAPGQMAVSFGTIVHSIDRLRSLVNIDGQQREVYNQYLEPAEDRQFFQSAEKNDLGLYSQVEQVLLDMKHPAWKQDKPAPGNEIWSKIKNAPGVKKEEIEWLDLQDFLTATPKAKFTRDAVLEYVRANGINIEETIAEQTEPETETDDTFDWSETIDDDSENYMYRVEDHMYEYDRTDWEQVPDDFYFIDQDEWDTKLGEEVTEMLESDEEYIATLEPSLREAIANYKHAEKMIDVGLVQDTLPGVEEANWEEQLEEAENTLREEVASFDSMRRWFEEQAEEAAREEYMDNPVKEYYDEQTEITIRGNDDLGYTVETRYNNIASDIYEWDEAEGRARDYAWENDLFEQTEVETDREEIVQHSGSVMDGPRENYREFKLKLPDIEGDFYKESHFPDRNILAFLRTTDRTLVGKFPEQKEIKFLEEKARALATEGITPPEALDFTSPDIPTDYYVQLPEGRIDQERMLWTRMEDYAADEERMQVGTWFQDTVKQAREIWAGLTPEKRQELYEAGYEQYIDDKIERVRVKGEEMETFFIDEFQSDWHNKGKKEGYKLPNEKIREMKEHRDKIDDKIGAIEDHAIKIADTANMIIKDGFDITLDTGVVIAKSSFTNAMHELYNNDNPKRIVEEYGGKYEAAYKVLNYYQEYMANSTGYEGNIFNDLYDLQHKRNELQRKIDSGTRGALDAPYKNDGWQQLGLKRAIVYAIENGYEAIAWPNTRVLTDRWSTSYREMYNIQYMQNMPKIAKKLMKEQPLHVSRDGDMMHPNEGEDTQGYWIVPINDQLRKDVVEKGFSLFQEARASIQFTVDDQSLIRLSRSSDLSSFLHETGHLFLETEKRFAEKFGVSAEMQPLLDWLGVDSFDQMTVEHHEKFAETFEVYLREGKAPSLKLRDAFAAFARWLTVIYRKLTDPRLARAQLAPEIKDYMDRMLASEAEIEQAMANPAYDQFFTSKEAAGMTQREWDDYQERREKVKNRAMDDVLQTAIDELRKRESKKWKEEKAPLVQEEKERLSKEPVYEILGDLSLPEGKMDWDMLQEEIGFDKHPPGRLRGKVKKGGIDPAWYAEAYGFRSVKQMVDAIVKAPTLNEAADQAAEARMIDKYGDILNDGRLELEAREAVTNEEQARLLIQEIRALNKKAPTIDRDYLKARAKDTIAQLKYKEIKPDKYDRARIKAAQNAVTAETKLEAIKFKTQQLVNHYLYKEALKARDRMAKQRRYVKATQTREYKGKDIDPMYIQNMVSLSNLYFMKDRVAQQAELDKLVNWFQSQINDPNEFVELMMLDPNLIAAIDAKERGELALFQPPHFDDLTSEELQGLYDMLRHMRFVGGKLAGEAKSETAQKIADIAESIVINSKKTAKQRGTPGATEDWRRKLSVFVNKIPSLRNLTRMLDGFDDNGIMYREVYREIEDAANRKLELSNDIYKRYEDEMNGIHKIGLSRSNKKDYTLQDGTNLALDSEHRFMMALYWGTESSRDAIRDGFGVTDTDVMNILNDLTDEQLDFVNATWRVNESMWPALSEVGVKISGVAPPKLDAAPFYVRGRKMTGGHMRLFYDSQEIELKQAREATTNMSKIMPTKAGSLNARVGSGGRTPALDKNNIVRSINENVHYIAFAPASEKIKALVNAKDVKSAIGATYGEEWYKAFIENIDHITNNRHERTTFEFAAKLSRLTRKAMTFKYLAYNIRNSMQQFSAIPIAIQQVGMPEFTWRLAQFGAAPLNSMDYVAEKSAFMRNRMSLVNREASEYIKKVTATSTPEKWWNAFTEKGFILQTAVDAMISYPVWTATYEQAINEGAKEKDAVSKADQAVAESVGSGSDLHLGGLFASTQDEWTKTLTVFGSWFNAYYQRMYKSSKGFQEFNADTFHTVITTPLVVGVLSAALVMDYPGDESDEKEWALWVAKQWGAFVSGTVPIWRDFWSSMTGFAPKNAYTSLMEAPKNMEKVIEDMVDPESKTTPLKQASRITKAATTVIPFPGSGNVTRVMDYIDSYQKGNEGNVPNYYQALVEGQERNK